MKIQNNKRMTIIRAAIYFAALMTVFHLLTYYFIMPAIMDTCPPAEFIVTVTDKTWMGGRTLYLVYARDEDGVSHVFENRDSFIHGKTNSSDIQEKIDVGKTYCITTIGSRVYIYGG